MPGEPSHFEIGVPDCRRAKAFYGELLGWSFTATAGENAWIETPRVRGGLHDEDDAKNIVVYFAVSDIEAAAARVRELGGQANEPGPEGGGGRSCACRDDQGVSFGLHQPPHWLSRRLSPSAFAHTAATDSGRLTLARTGGRIATGVTDRRGRTMAYSIKCADAGMDCPGSFTTETKEELMKHVELHGKESHPDINLQPEQVEALVKSSD